MEREEIKNKVDEIIELVLDVDKNEIKDDSDLYDDLGSDSLDAVELVMKCEESFDISIVDGMVEKVRTVNELIDTIEEELKN